MDAWIKYLIYFILGWLVAGMMGNGFSVGGVKQCGENEVQLGEDCFNLKYCNTLQNHTSEDLFGLYGETCNNCSYNSKNDKLKCKCKNKKGTSAESTFNNVSKCSNIINNDGKLECGANKSEMGLKKSCLKYMRNRSNN